MQTDEERIRGISMHPQNCSCALHRATKHACLFRGRALWLLGDGQLVLLAQPPTLFMHQQCVHALESQNVCPFLARAIHGQGSSPFLCIATDVETGEEIVLDQGVLARGAPPALGSQILLQIMSFMTAEANGAISVCTVDFSLCHVFHLLAGLKGVIG
jgi:hypothetical protein